MAFSSEPKISVRATKNKLPKLCPLSPSPFSNRCRNKERNACPTSLSSARATSAIRKSPTGRYPNSSRRRPVLPPLSATVTTAVMSKSSGGYFLSPDKTVYVPVPPPITTIFFCFLRDIVQKTLYITPSIVLCFHKDTRNERVWEVLPVKGV